MFLTLFLLFLGFVLGLLFVVAMSGVMFSGVRKRMFAHAKLRYALRRCEYETALEMTELFRKRGKATATYAVERGMVLLLAGQPEEAANWLRQFSFLEKRGPAYPSMKVAGGKKKVAAAVSALLGEACLDQGRFEEAARYYEEALKIKPDYGFGYTGMAEMWMRRERPADALKWATLAIEKHRAAKVEDQEATDLVIGSTLAILAWATAAALHHREEVDQLVRQSIDLTVTMPQSRAFALYLAGRAYAALEDRKKSAEYLAEAARFDRCRSGVAAREALTLMGGSEIEKTSLNGSMRDGLIEAFDRPAPDQPAHA